MDWKALIKEFETSGLNARQFSQQKQIKEHQLGYQLRKRRPIPATTNFVKITSHNQTIPVDPIWLAKFLKEVLRAEV
jgi:hypothetical protein